MSTSVNQVVAMLGILENISRLAVNVQAVDGGPDKAAVAFNPATDL